MAVSLTPREHIPGDGICDGCEDPVQLTQRGSSVIQTARNPRQDGICISADMATEIGKGTDLDGEGKTGWAVAGRYFWSPRTSPSRRQDSHYVGSP